MVPRPLYLGLCPAALGRGRWAEPSISRYSLNLMSRSSSALESVAASELVYLHACPICSSDRAKHYCRVPSLFSEGEFLNYERCSDCGTVRRNPRLGAGNRLDRYENDALRPEQKLILAKNQVHYRYMLALIESHRPVGCRFLDFGCGSGGFLREAKDAGYDVSGLELSKGLASFVRDEYGVQVYQGLVDDENFTDAMFDVIVSSQVFEHLLDPRATLRMLLKHLRRPGLVLIEVPNLNALAERLRRGSTMDDSHLFYFTASSLSRMLREAGCTVLRAQQGLRIYRFGALRSVPPACAFAAEQMFSLLRVRSGLGVLARLE